MFNQQYVKIIGVFIFVCHSTDAFCLEYFDYDINGDGKLSIQELRVKHLHETVPIYDKIDNIRVDGIFDTQELAAFYKSSETASDKRPDPLAKKAVHGELSLKEIADAEFRQKCNERKGLYVRGDRFDLGVYSGDFESAEGGSAKGASVDIASDGGKTTATIDGVVSRPYS